MAWSNQLTIRIILCTLLCCSWCVVTWHNVAAQTLPSTAPVEELPPPASKQELEALSKRVKELEAQLKQQATDKPKSDGLKVADKKAEPAWQDMSKDKWTVKMGGHVQFDYVNWARTTADIPSTPMSPGASDYYEFRRLRLVADGTGYGVYDFRLQMTLEPEAVSDTVEASFEPSVKDAYFTINELPFLGRLRIGNFFVPFSLEQVTNDTNNIFMERSIPTQGIFAVDREVGIATYQQSDDQRWTLFTGVFIDSISESIKRRIDDNQGHRISGRLTWLPYYDEPSNGRYLIHTGAGILYTADQDDLVRFRARPQVRLGPRLIDSGAIDADTYTTANLEFAIGWGKFTLQSEAFLSNASGVNGNDELVSGAYVHLSYFLTGENRIYERFGQHGAQFGRNVPFNNVFAVPGARSAGAWEAKVRWSMLDLNNYHAGQYNDITTGLNWYWSDRVRILFDWIHPITSEQTTYGATESDLLAMRFDFNW